MAPMKCLPLLFCFLVQTVLLQAQPLLNSRRTYGQQLVFQDIADKNKYYLSPHVLELARSPEGRPLFQLLSVRYTGTQLAGDKGEKRFNNLLQFTVKMPSLSAEDLKKAAHDLKLPPSARLLPLPLRSMEATIVSGVGEGITSERLVKRATLESEINNGKGLYWSERNFVMPLDNAEAQILADQFKNGRIAVSLNYVFYTDMLQITEESLEASGDSAFVAEMKQVAEGLERDTLELLEAVASGAIDIGIDAAQFPEALKQIDLNANSVPPAYPAVEVKCFDFKLDTRPDLAYKRITVEGISVNGDQVQQKIKFSKGQRDIITQFVSFRFAIRMDKPLRYRITEGNADGEETTGNWIQMEQFSNLIDASTPQKKNPVEPRCVEVEALEEQMLAQGLTGLEVRIFTLLNGREKIYNIGFTPEESPLLKTICIAGDRGKAVKYCVIKLRKDGTKHRGPLKFLPQDNYFVASK